jgi:glycosyltransferase involved in cell wall biosynthesis
MQPALVSCIVPVYNGEPYLREAIDSVLAQTYRPIEVIVVDDGSTDATAEILASYDDRLRSARQPNSGTPAARNLGLSLARGEFLAFLDADDLWHPEKLARQMARFQARSELDMCVTHAQNFWIPELHEEAARYQGSFFTQPLPGYVLPTLLVRRRFFDAVGPLDVSFRLGDDNDWFLRAYDQNPTVELLPEVLFYRRLHHTNLTRRTIDQAPEALLRIVKKTLDRRRRLRQLRPVGEPTR